MRTVLAILDCVWRWLEEHQDSNLKGPLKSVNLLRVNRRGKYRFPCRLHKELFPGFGERNSKWGWYSKIPSLSQSELPPTRQLAITETRARTDRNLARYACHKVLGGTTWYSFAPSDEIRSHRAFREGFPTYFIEIRSRFNSGVQFCLLIAVRCWNRLTERIHGFLLVYRFKRGNGVRN